MIRIITDSTSDFTLKEAQEKGVYLASLNVNIDGIEYKEGVNITHENFYDLNRTAKQTLTSQPSPEAFLELYEKAKSNNEKVIGIFVSTHLSGTFQSASIARDMIDYEDIYLIDTNNISVSIRLMVETALHYIKQGKTYTEVCSIMEDYKKRLDAFAIIDDLNHLKRSGRLSPAKSFLGSVLQLKPITTLAGKVDVVATVRGAKPAIEKTIELIEEKGGMDKEELCVVGYTGKTNQWYNDLKDAISKKYHNGSNIIVTPIGASVGNHVGAGTFAVGYFKNK